MLLRFLKTENQHVEGFAARNAKDLSEHTKWGRPDDRRLILNTLSGTANVDSARRVEIKLFKTAHYPKNTSKYSEGNYDSTLPLA